MNQENSKLNKIKKLTLDLLELSTIQGVPNLIRSKRILLKIMWLICLLASIALCSFFMSETIIEFLSYPTITTVTNEYDSVTDFPIVTICNTNNSYFNFSVFRLSFLRNSYDTWQKHFEIFSDLTYGLCFKFNSGKNLTKQSVDLDQSSYSGLNFGFTFEFYIQTNNDYDRLKVFIHDQKFQPSTIANKGHFISPGVFNYFSLDRVKSERLEEPYNDCIKDVYSFKKNRTLINYLKENSIGYSKDECMSLCFNLMYSESLTEYETCDCKLGLSEDFITKCIDKITNSTVLVCTKKFLKKFVRLKPFDLCNNYCPYECDSLEYLISHYTDPILSKGVINSNSVYSQFNTYENLTRIFYSINVYYNSLKYTLIAQKAKFGVYDLISNMGGTFGLFLGMTLMTFVELIEIAIQAILIIFDCSVNNKILQSIYSNQNNN